MTNKPYSLAQIRHLMRVEFSRAQRYGYPILCLMVAIDGLGHLRDRGGYEEKEAALDEVLDLLTQLTRRSDFIGRLPDDRLLIVVPHTPSANVFMMTDRLLIAAREKQVGGKKISLSIGASWLEKAETLFFDDLLETAERCLESAVAAGGDRCEAEAPGGSL